MWAGFIGRDFQIHKLPHSQRLPKGVYSQMKRVADSAETSKAIPAIVQIQRLMGFSGKAFGIKGILRD